MLLDGLEPRLLWKHFDKIRTIPRCSGHEEKAREYVLGFAREHKFEALHDETGNVVVKVPASPGLEKAPTVILQGHLDMVCEKNSDVDFDFSKDPIEIEIDELKPQIESNRRAMVEGVVRDRRTETR